MNKQTEPQQNNTVEANDRKTKETNAKNFKANASKKSSSSPFANKTFMMTGIALVVSLVSLAGAGFTYWQLQSQSSQLTIENTQLSKKLAQQQDDFKQIIQQITDSTKKQEALLNAQLANTQTKLNTLESDSTKLKAAQETAINQLAKINTDASQTWMLFEAKQLLKQAFFRLRASDINGASKLLEDLNETIKQRGDLSQAASKTNQAIESALLKLQQTNQVDLATLYSQLAAIQMQLAELPIKKPVFISTKSTERPASRWEKLSDQLSNYVRIDFNSTNKILPILTSQGVAQLKMTLDLSIEKAQWAAISGEASIYTNELSRVSQLLEEYFDVNSMQVKALVNKISQLKSEVIIVEVPDLTDTLKVINNYLDSQIAVASPANINQQPTGGNQ